MDVSVIFEDQHLMVIDKPPGLVVDESGTYQGPTLETMMKEQGIRLERGGVVHRLDKDTSGLLLVAKTHDALEKLQKQFVDRTVKKEYTALVHGFLKKEGKIIGAIERNPGNREKFMVTGEGKEAETEYEPKKLLVMGSDMEKIFHDFNKIQMRKLHATNYPQFTLVACRPLTGRTHQIRVHLKYIGYPIVSDEKYGGRKMVRLDKRWCPRQFLHASKIGFKHPLNGTLVDFESSLPQDLMNTLSNLETINNG